MKDIKEAWLEYYEALGDNGYCVLALSPELFQSMLNTTLQEYIHNRHIRVCSEYILSKVKGNNSYLGEGRMYTLLRKGVIIVIFEDTNLTGRSYRKLENKPKKLLPLNYC